MILDNDNPKVKVWNAVYVWVKPYIRSFFNAVDIGCREGGFAREIENDFKHIYCFDFRNKQNDFSLNVNDIKKFTYNVFGLGNENKITYTSSNRVGKIKDRGNVAVNIRTLDSFGYTDVSFIKIDVEGYEYRVLQGAEETIKNFRPTILVEQNKGNLDSVELLKTWGYRCIGNDPVKFHDYLMVPNESN